MADLSLEDAREFIASVREDNGGISLEDREKVEKSAPRVLISLGKTRKRLAAAIQTYCTSLNEEISG